MFEKNENSSKLDCTSHLKIDLTSPELSKCVQRMTHKSNETASSALPKLSIVEEKLAARPKLFAMDDEEIELPSTGHDKKKFPLGPGRGYDPDKGYEPLDGTLQWPSGGNEDPYA